MELTSAYHQLMAYNRKHSYLLKDGQVVFNFGYAWIVVFPAMNRYNYAVVKFYNGTYSAVEM